MIQHLTRFVQRGSFTISPFPTLLAKFFKTFRICLKQIRNLPRLGVPTQQCRKYLNQRHQQTASPVVNFIDLRTQSSDFLPEFFLIHLFLLLKMTDQIINKCMSATRNLPTRTLDVLEVLCGYAATGATNADLAHAAQTTPADISRITKLLISKGWARKSEDTGRFYPTAQFTRLTFRVAADFDRVQAQLEDRRRSMSHSDGRALHEIFG